MSDSTKKTDKRRKVSFAIFHQDLFFRDASGKGINVGRQLPALNKTVPSLAMYEGANGLEVELGTLTFVVPYANVINLELTSE